MCLDIEEHARVHKNYEAKLDYYGRQFVLLHVLYAWVADPPAQSGDSPAQMHDSWDIQSTEVPYGPELTDTLVLMTLRKHVPDKTPRMVSPEYISTKQVDI